MKRKLLLQFLLLFFSIYSFGQTIANQPPNLEQCKPTVLGPGLLFDLTLQTPIILGVQDPSMHTVTYYWQWGSEAGQTWDIDNPQAYHVHNEAPNFDIILAKVTNTVDGTVAYTTFEVLDISVIALMDTAVHCDGYHLAYLNIGNYYTEPGGPNGPGTLLPEGTILTEPIMLYLHAEYNNCLIEWSHFAKGNFYPFTGPLEPVKSCDVNDDGFTQFNLTSIIPEIIQGTWGNNVVTFYETQSDAEQAVNAIVSSEMYTNIVSFSQTIYVRKTDMPEQDAACSSVTSLDLIVEECVAGIDEKSLDSFAIYPNPASGNVNLILANATVNGFDVAVVDVLGKTILKSSFQNYEANLDINALNSGVYFISVTADGKQSTKKLIVK